MANFEEKVLRKIKFFHKKIERLCREGLGTKFAWLFEKNKNFA